MLIISALTKFSSYNLFYSFLESHCTFLNFSGCLNISLTLICSSVRCWEDFLCLSSSIFVDLIVYKNNLYVKEYHYSGIRVISNKFISFRSTPSLFLCFFSFLPYSLWPPPLTLSIISKCSCLSNFMNGEQFK